MRCERCQHDPGGRPTADYCVVCGRNLCAACMAGGCCGHVPARSGMAEDEAATIAVQQVTRPEAAPAVPTPWASPAAPPRGSVRRRQTLRCPLRHIVGEGIDEHGVNIETLECGHVVRRRQDFIGETNAVRRRCRACLREGKA
jgi:hypothetical protein